MKTIPLFHLQMAACLLLAVLGFQPSKLMAQGSLTPPGAPAPVMKTLAQIEPRTPISAAPFTINTPGAYYLTTNLTTTVSNAITISANGVTLDLGGFTISSTVASAAQGGTAILISGGLNNLTIQNGFIQGGVTNNGGGVYSGPGFANGIYFSSLSPLNARASGVSISGCLAYGVDLGIGNSTVVESCTIHTVGSYGIIASIIKSSVAMDCGAYGIYGNEVSDCQGQSTGNGVGVSGQTVQNSFGSSSSYYGLYALTAQNCYGSSSSSFGLYASYNAINCFGSSGTGTGLYTQNASFCTALGGDGTGIQATVATGCYSFVGTNIVTYKYNMP